MSSKNLYMWFMAWIGGSIQAGFYAGGATVLVLFLFITIYTIAVLSLSNIIFDEDENK